jgi:hypothetical protein
MDFDQSALATGARRYRVLDTKKALNSGSKADTQAYMGVMCVLERTGHYLRRSTPRACIHIIFRSVNWGTPALLYSHGSAFGYKGWSISA